MNILQKICKTKSPASAGLFEIKDKREDRREAVRQSRDLIQKVSPRGVRLRRGRWEGCKKQSLSRLAPTAPFTQGSLKNSPITEASFAFLQKPRLCSNLKICISSPIIKVSFAYFSFQRKVWSKKSMVPAFRGKAGTRDLCCCEARPFQPFHRVRKGFFQ